MIGGEDAEDMGAVVDGVGFFVEAARDEEDVRKGASTGSRVRVVEVDDGAG